MLPRFRILGESADGLSCTVWFELTEQSVYVSYAVLRDQSAFRRYVMWNTNPVVFMCVVPDWQWDEAVTTAIRQFEEAKERVKQKGRSHVA